MIDVSMAAVGKYINPTKHTGSLSVAVLHVMTVFSRFITYI